MNIQEIYLQPERYNARIKATVPSAWIVVDENGRNIPVCGGHEAKNADEVLKMMIKRGW